MRTPGLPCALCYFGGRYADKNSGAARRENAASHPFSRKDLNVKHPLVVPDKRAPGNAQRCPAASADPGPITPSLSYYDGRRLASVTEIFRGMGPGERQANAGTTACRIYPNNTASAAFTVSAPSVTLFSSDGACTATFSAKKRASAT
jgi:hypothetical protein